ncbi:hypothetical protein B0H21DRAFT_526939 [Amylocystis lapponica]|nr:hypothetical protein B0H21DRAFT_526939 [Amylocystis lapponica]
MRIPVLLLVSWWFGRTWALHASEAGVVDWHKHLIGVPLTSALSTAPTFHSPTPRGESVILAATANNVLAALSPANGSVAWRHLFESNEHIIGYKPHGDVVAAVSGSGGAVLRLLDVTTGDLLFEKRLHSPESGRLFEPETLGTSIAFDAGESADVFVLSNGHILRRVHGKTGEVVWGWTAPDQSSLVAYSKVVATPSTVYIIGLAKSFASYTLHVTALTAGTGEAVASVNVPSSIHNGLTDFLSLGGGSETSPRVVWLEGGAIKAVSLAPELKAKPSALKGGMYKHIVDVGLSHYGQLVALKEDGTSHVVELSDDGLRTAGELLSQKASTHIHSAHIAHWKDLVTYLTLPSVSDTQGSVKHAVRDATDSARVLITTATGTIQLWQQDNLQWSREEGLADIKVADLVELPERKVIGARGSDESETFGTRLRRQLSDAQDFPQYALNFARRFVTGSYASVSASVAPAANASEPLSRDEFGFRKIIVAATGHGKVYGIDSANGEIIWSRTFGLGWATAVGAQIIPVKLFATRTVSDGDTPQVVLVTQRKADNSLVDTVIFHIDVLTGDDVRKESAAGEALKGFDVISGPLVEAYLLGGGSSKMVVLLDEFVQVHLYPDTPENKDAFAKLRPSLNIPLRTGQPGHRQLTGHQISSDTEFTSKHVAYPTWSLSFGPTEEILSIVPRTLGPVASLGKVLGNRTTLYKYLNPHLVAVVTGVAGPTGARCAVYLVDGAKGTVIYHVVLPAVEGRCDVKAAFTENWLVYHYYDGESVGVDDAKSYRVVSVELYEGAGVDDKTRSSDMSSLSNETTAVSTFEQAYVFPGGITAMTTTSTSYGISVKDLIFANENGQIQSFPRRFLDPRRPKRKPTSQEMEEWLIQYEAVLPDDPKRVLSHHYEVARTKHIITSPALLESTSLVFAYGLDLFFTRVAPSGTFDVLSENFNKVQLVLTIVGLALAIVIAKPIVQRKRLRERWYD